MKLTALFDEAATRNASDIHLATGEVPRLRIAGDLIRLDLPALDLATFSILLDETVSSADRGRLEAGLSVERTILHGDLGFVGVFFRAGDDGYAATLRVLSGGIPSLDRIGGAALSLFKRLVDTPRGLALVTGLAGSGKWTTACSIADAINAEKPSRIFVVESHANYLFTSREGMVTQIHASKSPESYARALDFAFHADLDVVAVDDVPTLETLRAMLLLAETGHLVIANLHAENAVDALRRLLAGAGPETEPLRHALAANLVAVTGQRLLFRANGQGRVPAYDWLVPTPQIKAALETGDLQRLLEVQANDPECRSPEASVRELVQAGEIAPNPA
ncbi:type IV pilus twitching motility protein PilT [soil metagenome]